MNNLGCAWVWYQSFEKLFWKDECAIFVLFSFFPLVINYFNIAWKTEFAANSSQELLEDSCSPFLWKFGIIYLSMLIHIFFSSVWLICILTTLFILTSVTTAKLTHSTVILFISLLTDVIYLHSWSHISSQSSQLIRMEFEGSKMTLRYEVQIP